MEYSRCLNCGSVRTEDWGILDVPHLSKIWNSHITATYRIERCFDCKVKIKIFIEATIPRSYLDTLRSEHACTNIIGNTVNHFDSSPSLDDCYVFPSDR